MLHVLLQYSEINRGQETLRGLKVDIIDLRLRSGRL